MKQTILIFFLVSYLIPSFGQINSIDQLKSHILNIKNDSLLNDFLSKNDLIKKVENNQQEIRFHSDNIKIEIIKKNLFGDTLPEFVFQITEFKNSKEYNLNFFYLDSNRLKKVKGQIGEYFNEVGEYSYSIDFENIFSPEKYCLLIKTNSLYNRTTSTNIDIVTITTDFIKPIYSFVQSYSSYSGIKSYNYSTEINYKFISPNKRYPKVLCLTGIKKNEDYYNFGDSLIKKTSNEKIDEKIIFNIEQLEN